MYQDVIYLKSGKKLVGIIMKQIPNQDIILQTEDQTEIIIKVDSISMIQKEKLPLANRMFGNTFGRFTEFSNILSGGFVTEGGNKTSTFQLVLDALYNRNMALGLGVEYEKAPEYKLIPFYLDLRTYFVNAPVAPILYVNFGYSFGKNDIQTKWEAGGLLFGLGAGMKISCSSNLSIVIEGGYRRQDIVTAYQSYHSVYDPVYHSNVYIYDGVMKGYEKTLECGQAIIGIQYIY